MTEYKRVALYREAPVRNRNSKLGLLGVRERDGRYAARIMVDHKEINLGRFDTAQEANAAYVEAKRRLHEGCTL